MAKLEIYSNYLEEMGFSKSAKIPKTIIEKFNETRTIRINGKNVDDLELKKLGNLIQQATKKSSKFSFGRLFKGSKKSQLDTTKHQ